MNEKDSWEIETKEKIAKYQVTFKAHGTIEMTDYVIATDLNEALEKALEISKRNRWHIDRIDKVEKQRS